MTEPGRIIDVKPEDAEKVESLVLGKSTPKATVPTKRFEVSQKDKPILDALLEQERNKGRREAISQLSSKLESAQLDAQRFRREMQAEYRRGEHLRDSLNVANKMSVEAPRVVKSLERGRRRMYWGIRTQTDIENKQVNWLPRAIVVGLLFVSFLLYYDYQTEFWRWAYTGVNGYILGLGALLAVVSFLYYRRKIEHALDTGEG